MAEQDTELIQRTGHQLQGYGIEDLDDISYSSGTDDDSDYGADREDNDEYLDENIKVPDPGPFRYNRKMFVVSLPCAVMVLTLVGEIFLMAASFGAGVILILDPKGEKKRCLILFTLLFVCCHAFTIFSILPLLWLSLWNIFLIGVVNMYGILTAGLIALQFTYLRKYETRLALTIEKLLFSMYPWCCIILLTWTLSAVVRWELVPYIFIAIGFVYLQLFLTPHTSSFKIENKGEQSVAGDEDFNVVPEVLSFLMAVIYAISPSMLHIAVHVVHIPFTEVFSFTVFLHLIFILSLSVFLTTLMSLRGMIDLTGWPHKYVVTCRWVTGAVCTLLIYPVLIHYQLSSHFLPWLPAGVALYALYGALLTDKRFKGTSLMLLPLPCILFGYWMSWLPWKIVFGLLFGLDIKVVYFLLLGNCILCFLCVYTASYGNDSLFGMLVTIESIVFTLCEVMLFYGDLYPNSSLIFTTAVVLYTLHRLHIVGKLSSWQTTLSSAIHATKAMVIIIYYMIGTEANFTMYRGITLFGLSVVGVRIISFDSQQDRQVKDVVYNIFAMCVAIVMNSNPILNLVCVYVLWEEPTDTDILGLSVTVSGICVVIVGSLHMPSDYVTAVRQLGAVCTSMGVLILVLQPALAPSWSSLIQWGDVGSVVLIACVLLSDKLNTLQHLGMAAAVAGLCPGIRMATLLYTYTDDTPDWALLARSLLYIPACICLVYMLFIFLKLDVVQKQLEKNLLYLCSCLGFLSTVLLFVDMKLSSESEAVMSLPAWKLSTITTAVVSVSLKILSTTHNLLIPLVEEKREKAFPRLPLIGNIACIITFLLACVQSPFKRILNDIWCCGASLILLSLQKDNRLFTNIKQENQIVPTMFTCISILFSSSIYHSDLWDSSGLSFVRSFVELLTILAATPMFYIFWGILWSSKLLLSEQVVVFLVPMNAVYLLYGSSYSSQALALVGLYAGVWMMIMKLPLSPSRPNDYT